MRPLPAGVGIGAESGMHHGNRRFIIRASQVVKKGTELSHQKHSFVYDGSAGHGNHIGILVALFEFPAGNVQLPVKINALFHIFRLLDECLHNVRAYIPLPWRPARLVSPEPSLQPRNFKPAFARMISSIFFAWFLFNSSWGKKNIPIPYSRSPPIWIPASRQTLEKNRWEI